MRPYELIDLYLMENPKMNTLSKNEQTKTAEKTRENSNFLNKKFSPHHSASNSTLGGGPKES